MLCFSLFSFSVIIVCFSIIVVRFLIMLCSPPPPMSTATSGFQFPVILYNGQELIVAGNVIISPSDDYYSFKFIIGRLINVHPDYIKSYLVQKGNATSLLDYEWKASISVWTDFSLVCQQQDCCFLVFVKSQPADHHDMLQVREEERQTEMYQSHSWNKNVNEIQQLQQSLQVITCSSGVCEKCSVAQDKGIAADAVATEFHHCVCDAIVVNSYRTNFGPIGPPEAEVKVNEAEVDEPTGLYSLFGPMPGVDSLLHNLWQSLEEINNG